jgi:aspartate carbamoyltransferase catalytic subunit
MPKKFSVPGVEKFTSVDAGIEGADIVMALRLQKERMKSGLISSETGYFHAFGLTMERLEKYAPRALVMHPGPMNRNVEIADDVADDPERSLILEQVRNGVPTRMAALELLIENR